MKPFIFQISVKPDTTGEVGLPKMPVAQVQIDMAGLAVIITAIARKRKTMPQIWPY
jgi:hypothetical protein